jgi:alpha/beta superfamily hydrolase
MGLPVELYGLGSRIGSGKPLLVVQGEEDEFGSGEALARALADVGDSVTLVRIAGAGHFFDDHFEELKAAIREYFTEGPGAEAFPARE